MKASRLWSETEMIVMGLDPSTKTGVAVVNEHKQVLFTEEVEFKKLLGLERVQSIVARIWEIQEEYRPQVIVIEDMFVGHPSSAIPLIQIGSILRYFFWQEDLGFTDVPATVLKKFVVGKGNAKKEEVMMNVLKHWQYESPTNNIADAVGLAMIGLALNGVGFQKSQMAALSSLKE